METVIEGKLVHLFPTRTVGQRGDFRVRDFVLHYKVNDKDQHRKLQAVGRAVDALQDTWIGNVLRAEITLKGREYKNNDNELKFYNMDECHHVEVKRFS